MKLHVRGTPYVYVWASLHRSLSPLWGEEQIWGKPCAPEQDRGHDFFLACYCYLHVFTVFLNKQK